MAGVASPMSRRSHRDGVRFLIGLAVGGATAGLVLSVPLYLVGHVAGQFLSPAARLGLLAVLSMAFGIADLSGRTPQVWRQVPQRFVRSLPPGTLGLVWGFDLGLLVTTQKTSSLLWVSIMAVALLDPALAPASLVAISLVATTGIVAWSLTPWAVRLEGIRDRTWVRRARWATGTTMLLAGPATLLAAVLG